MKNFTSPLDRVLPRTVREDRGYVSDCWVFSGATNIKGYGRVRVDGVLFLTHRFVYEQIIGAIPDGLEIDHLCRVPACCNPEHLEPVTRQVNQGRGLKGALVSPVCPHGHKFTRDNTMISSRGARVCRECKRARDARYRANNKVMN